MFYGFNFNFFKKNKPKTDPACVSPRHRIRSKRPAQATAHTGVGDKEDDVVGTDHFLKSLK